MLPFPLSPFTPFPLLGDAWMSPSAIRIGKNSQGESLIIFFHFLSASPTRATSSFASPNPFTSSSIWDDSFLKLTQFCIVWIGFFVRFKWEKRIIELIYSFVDLKRSIQFRSSFSFDDCRNASSQPTLRQQSGEVLSTFDLRLRRTSVERDFRDRPSLSPRLLFPFFSFREKNIFEIFKNSFF